MLLCLPKNNMKKDTEEEKIVFYNRNKPSGEAGTKNGKADIIGLCLDEKRVFIGYPPFKDGEDFDENNIKSCTFDISNVETFDSIRDDVFIPKFCEEKSYLKQIKTNFNLVKEARPGSFVIIPRPKEGSYYIGKIKKFELTDNPTWIDKYKESRLKQGLKWNEDEYNHQYHVGDIIQSWVMEDEGFKEVSASKFPAWIRYSLFGRRTVGRVKDFDKKHKNRKKNYVYEKVYEVVSKLYSGEKIISNTTEIEESLLHFLSPSVFEHFMANLFGLKYKKDNQIWIHVGGSGDGGVDCLGYDKKTGKTVGIAQCKLKYLTSDNMEKLLKNLKEDKKNNNLQYIYVCNFYFDDSELIKEKKHHEIMGKGRITELFEKNKESNYWNLI